MFDDDDHLIFTQHDFQNEKLNIREI